MQEGLYLKMTEFRIRATFGPDLDPEADNKSDMEMEWEWTGFGYEPNVFLTVSIKDAYKINCQSFACQKGKQILTRTLQKIPVPQ